MASFACLLLRNSSSAGWQQFRESVRLEIGANGMIFRDWKSHQLLADCPKQHIDCIDEVKENELFRIKCQGQSVLAFRMLDAKLGKSLIESLRRCGHAFSPHTERKATADSIFPNLKDPSSKELILKLVFSTDFHTFVDELKIMLTEWSEKMSV
jgi:hypothetical protein